MQAPWCKPREMTVCRSVLSRPGSSGPSCSAFAWSGPCSLQPPSRRVRSLVPRPGGRRIVLTRRPALIPDPHNPPVGWDLDDRRPTSRPPLVADPGQRQQLQRRSPAHADSGGRGPEVQKPSRPVPSSPVLPVRRATHRQARRFSALNFRRPRSAPRPGNPGNHSRATRSPASSPIS